MSLTRSSFVWGWNLPDSKIAESRAAPLAGIRVLAFTHMLMGPAGAQYLADLGAEVIKVEPPEGARERHWAGADAFMEGASLFFLAANRNQRSVTIDLKSPLAGVVMSPLVAWADVVIETYRPGVMERLGLGYEELSSRHRGLVYVSGTGHGDKGPYANRPGQDLLAQSLSGLAAVTGWEDGPPIPVGAAVADQHAAALIAMAALTGLVSRGRTGAGCRIAVNLLRAALDLQLEGLTYHLNGHPVRRSSRPGTTGFHPAPYGIYATSDGHVAVSITPLSRLVAAVGASLDILDEDAYRRRDEVHDALVPVFLAETTATLLERLTRAGVWCGPVNDYAALPRDPQVIALKPFVEVVPADGSSYLTLGSPLAVDGYSSPASYPPRLGEHTDAILAEIGLDADSIRHLHEEGVI